MNEAFDSSERLQQQRLITESARAFARRELAPSNLRSGSVSRERWQSLAEPGLTAMLLSEEAGGLGLSIGDLVPALEELGKPLLREPLVSSGVLAGLVLSSVAKTDTSAALLSKLAEGTLVPAVAWQETYATLANEHTATSVKTNANGYFLDGRKILVLPGEDMDGMIVSARGDKGTALLWVDRKARGVHVEQLPTADGGTAATVLFDLVALGPDSLLTEDGAAPLDDALQAATICACAELLGLIRKAIEMTMDYLRTRKQFGRTIGSFQALQHRAADLYIQQELAAVALARAVIDFEAASDASGRKIAASRAKARCSSAALLVTKEAIQMHGGVGYTDEHDIGLYLKRALTLSAWLGNAAEHRARFASLTLGGAA